MDQFCMCGTQPGYLHKQNCPFPYFGSDPKEEERWMQGREQKNVELGRPEAARYPIPLP